MASSVLPIPPSPPIADTCDTATAAWLLIRSWRLSRYSERPVKRVFDGGRLNELILSDAERFLAVTSRRQERAFSRQSMVERCARYDSVASIIAATTSSLPRPRSPTLLLRLNRK